MSELKGYVEKESKFAQSVEEELELELEVEQEEEREIERPPPCEPYKNCLDEDVKQLVLNGKFNLASNSFISLSYGLDESSLKSYVQHKAWSKGLFITRDFKMTVHSIDEKDDFLRPPRWLCIHNHQ